MTDLILPRKFKLRARRADGAWEQVVFAKGPNESPQHVVGKVLLWALYLPQYDGLTVEVRIGDRYKPDVVSQDRTADGRIVPRFWGESGYVSVEKITSLARRYRETHFALAKWEANLSAHVQLVREALAQTKHSAPFDLLRFPPDSWTRFVSPDGEVNLTFDDLEWVRVK